MNALVLASFLALIQPLDPSPTPTDIQDEQASPETTDLDLFADTGVVLGARYAVWIVDLDFEVSTPTELTRVRTESQSGAEIYFRHGLGQGWITEIGLEVTLGGDSESQALVAGLSLQWQIPILQESGLIPSLRAGVLYGTYEIDDVPGDFDSAIGFEGGIEIRWPLSPGAGGLSLDLAVLGRSLKFDFDADTGATAAENEIGGVGAIILAGLEYRF